MTTANDSSGTSPTEEAKPNWSWLQDKIAPAQVAQLDDWFELQLCELEEDFAEFVTPKSLGRSLARSR
jgi:hypothetical protein